MEKRYAVVITVYISPDILQEFRSLRLKAVFDRGIKDLDNLTTTESQLVYAMVYSSDNEQDVIDEATRVSGSFSTELTKSGTDSQQFVSTKSTEKRLKSYVSVWNISDDKRLGKKGDAGTGWKFWSKRGKAGKLNNKQLKKMGVI